jgi:hypothetical protein
MGRGGMFGMNGPREGAGMPPPLPPPGMGMGMPGMPPGMGRGMPGMQGNRPGMIPPPPSAPSNTFGPPPGRGGGMMPPFGAPPGEGRGRGLLGGPFPDRPGPGRGGGMPPPGIGRSGPPMSRNGPMSPPSFNAGPMDRPERVDRQGFGGMPPPERPNFGGPPPSERQGFGGPPAWKPPSDQVRNPQFSIHFSTKLAGSAQGGPGPSQPPTEWRSSGPIGGPGPGMNAGGGMGGGPPVQGSNAGPPMRCDWPRHSARHSCPERVPPDRNERNPARNSLGVFLLPDILVESQLRRLGQPVARRRRS